MDNLLKGPNMADYGKPYPAPPLERGEKYGMSWSAMISGNSFKAPLRVLYFTRHRLFQSKASAEDSRFV